MRTFSLLLASLTILSACTAANNGSGSESSSSSSSVEAMDASSSSEDRESDSSADIMDDDSRSSDSHSSESTEAGSEDDDASEPSAMGPARVIAMTATDWEFSPKSITAKQGEKIVIRLTGVAGVHSIAIADLGLDVKINPGETKDIEIPTDKAGTFQFRCRVPCGPGHKDMMGTLVIEAA